MDHLPPVLKPHNPVIVPYLGGQYDGHTFANYPTVNVIDLEVLKAATTSSSETEAAAPVLQVWFFFGMMRETLDMKITLEDFVRQEGKTQRITTEKLRGYLSKWRAIQDERRSRKDTCSMLEAQKSQVIQCLRKSCETWRSFEKFACVVGPEIDLSIHILGCTLEHAVSLVFDIDINVFLWRTHRSDFVFSRMVEDGWCPAFVWQFGDMCRLMWQYYISLLGPPKDQHGPELSCKPGDLFCKLKLAQTSDKDNASKHVCQSATCHELEPVSMKIIEEIVQDGGIPLLDYDEKTAKLKVLKESRDLQYTAISHVWTDGLGNPYANKMPRCQLERLKECMQNEKLLWTNKCLVTVDDNDLVWDTNRISVNLSPNPAANRQRPLLFWIDTICVPKRNDLRKSAINRMRSVYNRANRVLVLDADLFRIHGHLGREETLARIACSSWVRRFWTLQEAILAKKLWFQFGDFVYTPLTGSEKLVSITTATDMEYAARALTYDNEVAWHCETLDFRWREYAPYCTYLSKVVWVWNAFQYRSSRFAEDQPVCVATLMDMDIARVEQLTARDRWRELWFMYEVIPVGVLFLHGHRLTEAPLRWAPASLNRLANLPGPGHSKGAILGNQGLSFTHHGIVSQNRLIKNRQGVIAFEVDDKVYLVRQNLLRDNAPWGSMDFTRFDRLAVLISQYGVEEDDDVQPFDRALGALVGITDNKTALTDTNTDLDTLHCEYLRVVSILLQGSHWEYTAQRPWEDWEELEKQDTHPAYFTRAKQKWLIT